MSTITTTTTVTETLSPPPAPSPKPAVLGKLRYVAAGHVPRASPHNFHLPDISEFSDERLLPLHNMRPLPTVAQLPGAADHAQLHTHGFTAVHHPVGLHSAAPTPGPNGNGLSPWKDPQALRERYIPETADMLRQITGCTTVVAESLLLRSAVWTAQDALATHAGHGSGGDATKTAAEQQEEEEEDLSSLETGFPQFIGFDPARGGASPAPKIHLDYAPAGARAHIRLFHPDLAAAAADIIRAEDTLLASGESPEQSYAGTGPRWALFSIWRPLRTVRRDPLALGDQRTFRAEDYVAVNVRTPCLGRQPAGSGATGAATHDAESYVARWSEGQKWYWVEGQTPEEALVVGLFDSDAERRGGRAAGGTLHSSVDLPGTEGEEARESLEMRCLCIWD